jgi:hypothetical protein
MATYCPTAGSECRIDAGLEKEMGLQLKDVKIIHYWRMRNDYVFLLNLSTETK